MRHHGKLASIVAVAIALAAGGAFAQGAPAGGASKSAAKPKAARAKPAKIAEACETDIAIFCGELEAKNRDVVRCLVEAVSSVSPECSAAVGSKKR